jgi:hypothetical protein
MGMLVSRIGNGDWIRPVVQVFPGLAPGQQIGSISMFITHIGQTSPTLL